MSKEGLEKQNQEFKKFLEDNGVKIALLYKPISDEYWTQKYKVLFCNEEPYNINYGWNGIKTFSEDVLYEGWIKNQTIRRTLKIYYLFSELVKNKDFDIEKFNFYTVSNEELIKRFYGATYCNIKPTFSPTVKSNKENAAKILNNSKYQEYLKNYLKELEPNMIVFGGSKARNVINKTFPNLKLEVNQNPITFENKCKILAIPHLSRCSNKILNETVRKIYEDSKKFISNIGVQ